MFYLKARIYGIKNTIPLSVYGKQFIFDRYLPANSELAKRKCREYLESDIACILVEFSDRFALYLDANSSKASEPLQFKGEIHLICTI
ncbi:MAG: hypothetical protein ACFBSE_27270 [Prochloraceae cyanobacterium]